MSISNKRLREGDKVVVIAGNDKGKVGNILSRKDNEKIVVQGINVRKKHVKRTQNAPGRIVNIEAPIHACKVMLCPIESKGVKLKARVDGEGKRSFVYKDDKGKEIVYRDANKKAK